MDGERGRPVRDDWLASPERLAIQDELMLSQQGQALVQSLPASLSSGADAAGDSVSLSADSACNRTSTS